MQNKDKCKSQPLKIAVTGHYGSGISSFINVFRGLSAKDKGAARVGLTETTNKIRSYTCTGNSKYILFDLPGVGSAKFPKATYLEDIGFNEFDFFIILSSRRFTEDDVWLGKTVKGHRKQCFYVRTKIDIDIINDKYDEGDAFNEAATIENVRQEARKYLNEANVDAPIYLITNRSPMRHTFDFASLVSDMNGSARELKGNDLRAVLQDLTENVTGNMNDIYDGISEKDQSLIKSVYKEEGLKGLKDVIMQNKNKWKSQPLKIAVTGNTGSGKSSFINAFCGLSSNDKGAAQIGVTETTNEIRSYSCTGNNKLVLFDLPGVGSRNYPKEIYMEEIGFEKFDFFIIITSCRFSENDAWLGKMVKKHTKQCFYVRTKVDSDILSESYDKGEDFNEAVTIEQIREDARKCLFKANVDAPVYLITTRQNMRNTFDLSSLIHAINDSAMDLKRNALLVLLQTLAENVINEKMKPFKDRAGTSVGVDEAAIQREASHYRNTLFLDEESLKGVHDTYSINIDELKLTCREKQLSEYLTPKNANVDSRESLGKIRLPFFGLFRGGKECHDEMPSILYKIIADCEENALKLIREIFKRMI